MVLSSKHRRRPLSYTGATGKFLAPARLRFIKRFAAVLPRHEDAIQHLLGEAGKLRRRETPLSLCFPGNHPLTLKKKSLSEMQDSSIATPGTLKDSGLEKGCLGDLLSCAWVLGPPTTSTKVVSNRKVGRSPLTCAADSNVA